MQYTSSYHPASADLFACAGPERWPALGGRALLDYQRQAVLFAKPCKAGARAKTDGAAEVWPKVRAYLSASHDDAPPELLALLDVMPGGGWARAQHLRFYPGF